MEKCRLTGPSQVRLFAAWSPQEPDIRTMALQVSATIAEVVLASGYTA